MKMKETMIHAALTLKIQMVCGISIKQKVRNIKLELKN
jgi:hypothetical protein